jgi:hypothetical protein
VLVAAPGQLLCLFGLFAQLLLAVVFGLHNVVLPHALAHLLVGALRLGQPRLGLGQLSLS